MNKQTTARALQRWLVAAILLLLCPWGFAQSPNASLHAINHFIAELNRQIQHEKARQRAYQMRLKQSKKMALRVHRQLKKTRHQLELSERKKQFLHARTVTIQQQLAQAKKALRANMRAFYTHGIHWCDDHSLSSPNRLSRGAQKIYARTIAQEQIASFTHLTNHHNYLAHLQRRTNHLADLLKKTQRKETHRQNTLLHINQHRQALIHSIKNKIKIKNRRLAQLQHNKHALEHTLSRLRKQTQPAPRLKGSRLQPGVQWPLTGVLIHHFNDTITGSQLHWNGVLIHPSGALAIHAIAAGRVIFNQILAGYGHLIIIQHDQGYMSLYGHCHHVMVHLGQTVQKHQTLANVDHSGGSQNGGLYFAIRHHAVPLNPAHWCRKT